MNLICWLKGHKEEITNSWRQNLQYPDFKAPIPKEGVIFVEMPIKIVAIDYIIHNTYKCTRCGNIRRGTESIYKKEPIFTSHWMELKTPGGVILPPRNNST